MYQNSFFDTAQGQKLLNCQLPQLTEAMETLAAELKRYNDMKEFEIKANTKEEPKRGE